MEVLYKGIKILFKAFYHRNEMAYTSQLGEMIATYFVFNSVSE